MFDQFHYVPVLKGRAGELRALREADARVLSLTTPLIEVPPVPWDFEAGRPAKEPASHLASFAASLARSVSGERRFFLDGRLLAAEDALDGEHPVGRALDASREAGLRAVVVCGVGRGEEHERAVRRAVDTDDRGVCLRLEADDLQDPDELPALVEQTLEVLGLHPRDIDLMLDLGPIDPEQRWLATTARLLIGAVPDVGAWRSLTLAASSFPLDLSGVAGGTVALLPRAEWSLWRGLLERSERLARIPTFADYAVSHPVQREIDPRIIQVSASIRYTTGEEFLVLKGRSLRREGSEQYFERAAELVAHPGYHGERFSWGDAYIAQVARREAGPGNPEIWRRAGVSQHLAITTAQIEAQRDAAG